MHGKDEALRFIRQFVRTIPIPAVPDGRRGAVHDAVQRLVAIANASNIAESAIIDWLRIEHGIDKPGNKLSDAQSLNSDDFVEEVKKRRGKKNALSVAALKMVRDEYAKTIAPLIQMSDAAKVLENQLSDCVNEAFGLTHDEIDLMWKTAPPRMPIPRPPAPQG